MANTALLSLYWPHGMHWMMTEPSRRWDSDTRDTLFLRNRQMKVSSTFTKGIL